MTRVVLLGPPGCGKGTQAARLSRMLEIPAISTGDMLRAEMQQGTSLGKAAQECVRRGELVADDIMIGMIEQRLQQPDAQAGFLLDGFPRTVAQADALAACTDIDDVVELRCDSEVIVERMSGRRIHPASGRVYHVRHNPPRSDNVDDITGEPLAERDDDREEIVRERLQVYARSTAPLSGHYAAAGGRPRHHIVAAEGDIDEITERIARILKR